jgi:hypothetical protein
MSYKSYRGTLITKKIPRRKLRGIYFDFIERGNLRNNDLSLQHNHHVLLS